MSEQLSLGFCDEESELMNLIRAMVAEAGTLQEVAHALGMSDAALSNALAERNRRVIPIQKLPRLVKLRGGERIVRWLAHRIGLELIAYVPPSVDEEYVALSQVIREQLGEAVRKPLLRAQRERVAANRGAVLRVVNGGVE